MKKINLILGILLAVLLHSCYVVHKQIIKEFDYCYDGSQTKIGQKININGYYTVDYYSKNEQFEQNKARSEIIMFSDDGIFIIASSLNVFLDAYENKQWDSKGFDMGIYKIHNDTIRAEYLYIGSATSGCSTVEYKILDENTLEKIHYGNCETPSKSFASSQIATKAMFTLYDKLPKIDKMWAKNKKWFWCNGEDYKTFKKSSRR